MGEEKDTSKRIPNLCQDNHERWFRQMRIQLRGKDWFYTVEADLNTYAKVATADIKVHDVTEGFENLTIQENGTKINIRLSIDKKAKYLKDEASALSYICRSLSDDDEALADEYETAIALWEYLKSKYTRISAVTANSYMTMIQNFTYQPAAQPEMTIIEAWDKLKEYRRHLGAANAKAKDIYNDDALLLILTRALPEEYRNVIDILHIQTNLSIEDKIKHLQAKELRLQDNVEHANIARGGRYIPPHRRGSNSDSDRMDVDTPSRSKFTCHLCREEGHMVRDCLQLPKAQRYLERCKVQRSRRSKEASKTTTTNKKPFPTSKKTRAHFADNDSEENHSDYQSVDEDAESEAEECHISKDRISKANSTEWYADTGASSHMSDQLSLFRNLKSIRLRIVRVGGGVMYCRQKGTVNVVCKDGSRMLLSDVLYVPGLGVNLLSARRTCEAGLKGRFDPQYMYFQKKNIKIIEAKMRNGMYVIAHVADGYEDTAFPSTEILEGTKAIKDQLTPNEMENYLLWHRRFNHLGPDKIRNLHKVTTLGKPIKVPTKREICEVCVLTKMTNRTPKELSPHKSGRLQLIQFDIAGPFQKSIRGNRYFILIIDSWTRANWVLPLKRKSDAIPMMLSWKKEIELETGVKVIAARTDNAPELIQAVEEWKSGVRSELTTIASSNQNGAAERNIRTAEADMRAMLKEASLPLEFWDEAAEYDAYCRNRTDTGPVVNSCIVSPTEAFTGTTPDVDHCKVWGSKCYVYINPKTIPKGQRHDKLRDTARVGIFMGYSRTTNKHIKVYSPELGYTVRSSRAIIDETKKGGNLDLRLRNCASGPQGTQNSVPDRNPRGRPRLEPEIPEVVIPQGTTSTSIPRFDEDENGNIKQVPHSPVQSPAEPLVESPAQSPDQSPAESPVESSVEPSEISQEDVEMQSESNEAPRYFMRKRKLDDDNDDSEHRSKIVRAMLAMIAHEDQEVIEHAMVGIPDVHHVDPYIKKRITSDFKALVADTREHPDDIALPAKEILGIKIPRNYKEAISDKNYSEEWKLAIEEEVKSLVQNGTWEEFILPKGSNLVSTKWVFTIKTKNSRVERFKARLVARGFSQVLGKDYNETFAPTVRMDTLRLFLAIVAKEDLECSHFDIKNAFTESHLKEEIYLAPPQGVTVRKGHVLHALRSLYGLKQAGRDWSLLLKEELIRMGFVQSLADPCLYICQERKLYLLVYVDDILAASSSQEQIDWFSTQLSARFKTKNLREISKILGIRVIRDRKRRTLTLDQEEYLDAALTKFGITHAQYVSKKIPAADYHHLRPATGDDEMIDTTEYQQAIGSMIHPMVYTRPDIAFVLGRLSQYMAKPAKHHGLALKNLMRYLRSTIKQKICYGPGGVQSDIAKEYGLPTETAKVYTDADWASDRHDRKSISGGVVMFYGGPISWSSKKQNSVATSSAESEYISMAMFVKQGRWVAQVLKDLGKPEYISTEGDTVQVLGDNQGALALTKNPHLHERSKHIDICYHFIRDLTEKGKVTSKYINTTDMVADGMTKPLGRVAFERFKHMLGLVDSQAEKSKVLSR